MNILQGLRDFYASKDNWCVGKLSEGSDRCALGHIIYNTQYDPIRCFRSNHLYSYLSPRIKEISGKESIAAVNDDVFNKYFPGEGPKERVLNFLDMLIAEEKLLNEVKTIANTSKSLELV